jgi:hypothetical protein
VNLRQVEFPAHPLRLDASTQWWDPDTECTLLLARPQDEPDRWDEYLAGAERSYRRHGVECALDLDAIRDGSDTAMFLVAIDDSDRIVCGVRAKGPLTGADDSHAVVEWAGQPGLDAVRKMIDDRAPFGILEMKSAWVSDSSGKARDLTKVIARSGFHAMAMMDIQFCMATAGEYVLDRWKSSGGVVAAHIPPTPYPDERYNTKMMWWDRRTFAQHAEPEQLAKILRETATLREATGLQGALA